MTGEPRAPRPARLGRNLLFLYGGEGLGKVLGVVVFGYLGHTLLEARYGDLEFAIGILFVMQLVMDAGLAPFGAREAAQAPSRTAALAAQIMTIRGVILLASALVLAAVAYGLDRDDLARGLILAYGLALIPGPFVLSWAFEARDEMAVVGATSLTRQVVLAAGVLTLVHAPDDVLYVPLCEAAGWTAAVSVQQLLFRRRVGPIHVRRHLDGLGQVVRRALPLTLSAVVWAVRLFAPLLALGVFRTSSETGIFGGAHRLMIAAHTFVWLYFVNLLPSFSRLSVAGDAAAFDRLARGSMRLVAWIVVTGALAATLAAPRVTGIIYGFPGSGAPLAVMAWMLAVAFISGHHRYALIAHHRQKDELLASAAGCAVSLGACLVLRARLEPVAAAAILLSAETTTLVVAARACARRARPIPVLGAIWRPAVAGGLAFLAAWTWGRSWPLAAAAGVAVVQGAAWWLLALRPARRGS